MGKAFLVGKLLYTLDMTNSIKMHYVVALTDDVRTKHFETGQELKLRRDQIGTVVMMYEDGACEVEFADREGRAFALLPLGPEQLMVLYDMPDFAAA